MIVLITQPTFLPWIGYFDQMRLADIIVFLDSVQYARRGWQNRNRIVDRKGKEIMLTLPIKKCRRETLIKEVNVSDSFIFKNLVEKVKSCYKDASNLESCIEIIENSLSKKFINKNIALRDINRKFIEDILDLSGIKYKTLFSSEIEEKINYNSPTERLLAICKYFKATTYLSAPGAKEYMQNELYKFDKFDIMVKWHAFHHLDYIEQNFIPYLSVIDYLAHNSVEKFNNYLKKCSKF